MVDQVNFQEKIQDESLPVMDESVKDRTVTQIATISITVVGLVGLWVIINGLWSSGLPWKSDVAKNQVAKTSLVTSPVAILPSQKINAGQVAGDTPDLSLPATTQISAIQSADEAQSEKNTSGGIPQSVEKSATGAATVVAAPESQAVKEQQANLAEVLTSQPIIQHAKTRRPQQFGVQLGVFNSVANAENLRRKMQAQGVPVIVESRVHIGPFATQAEADQARAKLKAMGINESALVILK